MNNVRTQHPNAPLTPEGRRLERFHRILLEEWAYLRPWTSEAQRDLGYVRFIHFYNEHRSHGALGWSTPISVLGDNVSGLHN